MAKKGENIYKRKDGRWEGRYIKGYKENKKPAFGYIYGRSYQSVKQKLIEKKAEYCIRRDTVPLSGNISLQDWSQYWLYQIALPKVKQSTFGFYQGTAAKHLVPSLGEIALHDFTPEIVRSFLSVLTEQGLSPSTIRNIFRLLKSMMEDAVNSRRIPSNPCTGVRPPQGRQRGSKSLTKTERKRLIASISGQSTDTQLEVLLPLYTGLRVGELCALRMKDIDFKDGIIHVRETLQRVRRIEQNKGKSKTQVVLTSAKSEGSQREIPIPPPLLPLLKQKKAGSFNDAFLLGDGNKPMEPRTVQRHFHQILKKAGLAPRGMHALRHTFATLCLENGADIVTISELLGHSDAAVTFRYLHTNPGRKRKVIGLLSRAG